MAYSAQVFRILIASPSDVSFERDIAVRVIQAWNDLNSHERQIVLLPLRWETHSAPEYGRRPQEVINRQVVDDCDLLVGVFWTRIGTPTGEADSGTLEEIERVANDGKLVMLYFSQARQDPDEIDLDQLKQLRDFKKKTFPKALVETYQDHEEFRDKLARQIEIQLRTILATQDNSGSAMPRPVTDIQLHFAVPDTGDDAGTVREVQSTLINMDDFERLPDFESTADETESDETTSTSIFRLAFGRANASYYRQRFASLVLQNLFEPVRFWLKNIGGVGARDVYLDLSLKSSDTDFIVFPRSAFPSEEPEQGSHELLFSGKRTFDEPSQFLSQARRTYQTHLEIRAMQPLRELSPQTDLFVGTMNSGTIDIEAMVYADTLSRPERQTLELKFVVEQRNMAAAEFLKAIDADAKPKTRRRRSLAKRKPKS